MENKTICRWSNLTLCYSEINIQVYNNVWLGRSLHTANTTMSHSCVSYSSLIHNKFTLIKAMPCQLFIEMNFDLTVLLFPFILTFVTRELPAVMNNLIVEFHNRQVWVVYWVKKFILWNCGEQKIDPTSRKHLVIMWMAAFVDFSISLNTFRLIHKLKYSALVQVSEQPKEQSKHSSHSGHTFLF